MVVINDDEENNFISYGLAVSFEKISRTKSKIISKKKLKLFSYFFGKSWREIYVFSQKRDHGSDFSIKMKNLNGHGSMVQIYRIRIGARASRTTGKLLLVSGMLRLPSVFCYVGIILSRFVCDQTVKILMGKSEACVEMYQEWDGKWNDAGCHVPKEYICELDYVGRLSQCDIQRGWKEHVINSVTSCYLYDELTDSPWYEAEQDCESKGWDIRIL